MFYTWAHSVLFNSTAAISKRQIVYKSETSKNYTVSVGMGNLKLVYSGNDGKLAQYINSRTLVCHYVSVSVLLIISLSFIIPICMAFSNESLYENCYFLLLFITIFYMNLILFYFDTRSKSQ